MTQRFSLRTKEYWRQTTDCTMREAKLACRRASSRTTLGCLLSKHQSVREDIARCFSEITMARRSGDADE